MSDRTRLALFGGSFDPVHRGHLETAARAGRVFDLERVVWIPAARPPHKEGVELAPGPQRLAMLLLATMDRPDWQVSEVELAREGPSYTFDTVSEAPRLAGLEPDEIELFLILGSDNLPGLPGWHRAEELLDRVQPIVAWRDGTPEEHLAALGGRLPARHLAKLERGFLRLAPIDVSATDLRARLAAGEDVGDDVPPPVLDFIRAKGLYGAVTPPPEPGPEPGPERGDEDDDEEERAWRRRWRARRGGRDA